jgi:hypothetical protein
MTDYEEDEWPDVPGQPKGTDVGGASAGTEGEF